MDHLFTRAQLQNFMCVDGSESTDMRLIDFGFAKSIAEGLGTHGIGDASYMRRYDSISTYLLMCEMIHIHMIAICSSPGAGEGRALRCQVRHMESRCHALHYVRDGSDDDGLPMVVCHKMLDHVS